MSRINLLAGDVWRLSLVGMGYADLAAQDAGRQASLDGGEDGPQIRDHHRHAARTAAVNVSRPAS